MVSSSKCPCMTFTAEEAAEICARDGSDAESDIDSNTGGISSGEDFDLDQELEGNCASERMEVSDCINMMKYECIGIYPLLSLNFALFPSSFCENETTSLK